MADAYLDNALTPAERARFEAQMAADPRLRTEVEQMRALRLQMRAMPRRRVPRSFALDPATYARPKAQPLLQLYPVLRGATAMTAFLLIFVLALGAFRGQFGGAPEASVASSAPADQAGEMMPFEAIEEAPAEDSAEMAANEAMKTSPAEEPAAEEETAAELAEPPAELEEEVVPESDLADLALEPEATLPPNAGGGIDESALAETPVAEGAIETFAMPETANDPAVPTPEPRSPLLYLQIGLGALFLVLLLLWLVARRRARRL